jgi:hypothetical protein
MWSSLWIKIIVLLGPQNSVIKGYEVYWPGVWVSGLVGFSGYRNFSIYGHWILRSCVTSGATLGNIIVPHRSFGYSEYVVYKHFYWFTCCSIDPCNTQIVKANIIMIHARTFTKNTMNIFIGSLLSLYFTRNVC